MKKKYAALLVAAAIMAGAGCRKPEHKRDG